LKRRKFSREGLGFFALRHETGHYMLNHAK
jgi:hypothetical protein